MEVTIYSDDPLIKPEKFNINNNHGWNYYFNKNIIKYNCRYNNLNYYAFHWACEYDELYILKYLIEKCRQNINIRDGDS